jgi:acetyl-CoA acetyltransferase
MYINPMTSAATPAPADVGVAGVGMYRFGRMADVSLREMAYRAGTAAMHDAGVTFDEVGAVYVGHISQPLMTGVIVVKEFGLTGVPVQHITNASATGSTTFREAYHAVAGGQCDIALALAFDDMEAMPPPGERAASVDGVILPAAFFALWARRRMETHGTTAETFAEIAAKNWNHAALSPMAQRHADHVVTAEEVLASRMVADPLTSKMSAAVGAGAAAAIVCTREVAERLRPDRPFVRIAASALQTERYQPDHVFVGPVTGASEMTRHTAQEAYERSGIGPDDVDLVQVHDAFPIEELEYYELLGICEDGHGDELVRTGATRLGGRIPFSTDGGLIGRGHPGGPTGLAQIWETTLQLRGEAVGRQVDGARVGLCHMVGGGSVCAIHILVRD